VRPVAQADALPERAVRYVPLVGQRPPARATAPDGPAPAAAGDRPLRLVTPPPPIEAVSAGPDGPPAAFGWQGRRHAVAQCWGPERIETGWWRRGIVRRDYYRVETDAGRRFWLFRDLVGGGWHLHGSFE
jgi:protein ImuB